MPAGRPRKHGERGINKVVLLPETFAKGIEETALTSNLSVSDLLYSMIVSSDKKLSISLAKSFNEMKDHLKELLDDNKKKDEKYHVLMKRLGSNTLSFVIGNVYENPELNEMVEPVLNEVFKTRSPTVDREVFVGLVHDKLKAQLHSQGKFIKNRPVLKSFIEQKVDSRRKEEGVV